MKDSNKAVALNVVIGAVAYFIGANALIPALAAMAIGWATGKLKIAPSDPNYANLVEVLGGYATWLTVGALVMKQPSLFVDIGIMVGLGIWLWFAPGFWSFMATLAYLAAGLVFNVRDMGAAPFASDIQRALVTHLLIRLLALGLLVWAFWKQVQREREAERALLARISAS